MSETKAREIDFSKMHLSYSAYVSLLKRADEYEDDDWLRATKYERHATNATIDLRNALAENAELRQLLEQAEARHREYQEGLEKVARAVGVTTPLELIAEADNNEQSYFDLLVKIIKRDLVEKLERAEAVNKSLLVEMDKHASRIKQWQILRTACEPIIKVARKAAHGFIGLEAGDYPTVEQWQAFVVAFDGEEKRDGCQTDRSASSEASNLRLPVSR